VSTGRAMTIAPTPSPFDLFAAWFRDAEAKEPGLPHAMSLATVGRDGAPSLRMVLLKGADARGFVFYTNLESQKGVELGADPRAALCFHWKSLNRQVRVEGSVTPVDPSEADAYWAIRPREFRVSAWASRQSRSYRSRAELDAAVARYDAAFPGEAVPRPAFWSGFRLVPRRLEFWQEQPSRLHDRLVYIRVGEGWATEYLYP